ncbi:1-aminocyclopropane-1-carboxylate deaminase/D-cysteine desulfhydrase [Dyadobacter arcticus]|uniref:1-aminocyclopropane-1-carboxylate deaminase/D-cysteine desulfhydrase-like pyridoxal-dependent ACC family enzyme n=1 Tax=Dyadobacter arcticus TaxID=1078754 RepID=A0ABX0UL34_9BACT|nr:pyridoxal-phosphate dependent enzyme [Dyadobacter arcticus]NIJ53173.1 1-aminocyclopropane-1-carboxylate deaminase/D-cysteine desulfhydrase-like pyridoxal-dependent ACC family enzyme [Dyadobacter arcticus]
MDLLGPSIPTSLQEISNEILRAAKIRLYVKRDDLIHPVVSGNKWRKLKYNLLEARATNQKAILTFGGAKSNHLYATSAAGKAMGFETIGIIRGEEYEFKETDTLKFCKEQNMQLHFVSREEYKSRNSIAYLYGLVQKFNYPFIIPEGGTSSSGMKGVSEMVEEVGQQLGSQPDFYAVAAGTGGTAAGIMSAGSDVLAFSALKGGEFLEEDIHDLLIHQKEKGRLTLFTEYHFGGYAKWNSELMDFINRFNSDFDIQLEQVYTAKMFYGLFDLIQKGYFLKNTTIVAVHTGGLQGLI